ncbi:MAG: DUF2007 domain-containing protein [Prevotella sp.]|jgi:hypothetical protein|nr:DUF2007 domain-containing protein [Prevotella sp.]
MAGLITIMASDVQSEIMTAKLYLESNDITCFLKDELTNQVHPAGIGGVKLQVYEDDAMRAAELLIEGGYAKKEDYEIPESTMRMVKVYEKISSFFKSKK